MPTKLRMQRGETRPSQINLREPKPPLRAPKPPADIAPEARAVWRHVVRSMPVGVIREPDADILRLYCETVVRCRAASTLLAGSGLLVRGRRDGELVKNPPPPDRPRQRRPRPPPRPRARPLALGAGEPPDRARPRAGRQALATAIFARTDVMGFERLEYDLTPEAIELGLDAALPAVFELTGTIGEFGRGERI